MSGGHFDYVQIKLEDIVQEIRNIVENNDSNELNEYGDRIGKGFHEETLGELMTGATFIMLASKYIRRIDYLLSGDDGEDTFHARLREDIYNEEG